MGTTTAPIAVDVTAEIVITDSPLGGSVPDPEQFGTGINVFGQVSMHGSLKTPTFLRLAAEPRAGNTTLTLSAPVAGWKIGDRLVLPDTRHIKESEVTGGGWVNAANQWEERTVQAISADARILTLNSALQYDHLGARDLNGVLEFLPHVGNLTRNVVIRSENPSGTRGHMLSIHLANVDIRYVELKDMGRTTYLPLNNTTNHIGRYAIHVHHLSGNEAYGAMQGGFTYWWISSQDPQPYANAGGPNNYVRNNVAANFQNPTTEAAYGFVYQFRYLGNIAVPNFKGADTIMAIGQSTIGENSTGTLLAR